MDHSIIIENLSKNYGDVLALDNINLSVKQGEIFGLIGPDGAGKTTLFEILVTLLAPTQGRTEVCGLDSMKDSRELRNIVGYMPGKFSLYQDLSVKENLTFFADIFSTSIEEGYELIKDIWTQIEPFKKRRAGKLSGGMKQKLALCCALVHSPKVLFLDEPTTGVDPVSRKEFWQMLQALKASGITIFASTPYMDEAILCDRVSLIQQGRIMRTDTPERIIKTFEHNLFDIKADRVHSLLTLLLGWEKCHSCNTFGQSVHFVAKTKQIEESEILEYIQNNSKIQNVGISRVEATIEDCFMELMTKENGNNN